MEGRARRDPQEEPGRLAGHARRSTATISTCSPATAWSAASTPAPANASGPARAKEFGGGSGGWGYAESVLIHKDLAIFKPGGKNCIVALNKTTGETVWTSSGFEAGPEYGSCLPVTFNRTDDDRHRHQAGIVAVDAKDGKLLWSNEFSARNTANCPTPAYADGYVFWANGYGNGGICLKLKADGDSVTADVAWTTQGHGLPPRRLRDPRTATSTATTAAAGPAWT